MAATFTTQYEATITPVEELRAPIYRADTPHYPLVPKNRVANLEMRKWILEEGYASKKAAYDIWCMCSRDILFYINMFCWTYNPRLNKSRVLPFITWRFQDETILAIVDGIRKGEDVAIVKSRDMGATWQMLLAFDWFFKFHSLRSFMCVSRKEELVDKRDDPDSMFWKLDFNSEHQPLWIKGSIARTSLHFKHNSTGGTIDGCSTTGDAVRGGRRSAVGLDEFSSVKEGNQVLAATADATNCRVFNSTPKGVGNAFYTVVKKNPAKIIYLHWSKHPEKAEGAYATPRGKVRSPWYDDECLRRAHPAEIAQEIDMNFLGSDYQWFDADQLVKVEEQTVCDPFLTGELEYSYATLEPDGFRNIPNGKMLLWMEPAAGGVPASDRRYVAGADVSAGTQATNSVLTIIDHSTNTKVAELVASQMSPTDFAHYCIAVCRWFKGYDGLPALLIWEAQGPGIEFARAIEKKNFRNIYWRRDEQSQAKRNINQKPGWYATGSGKKALLGQYRKALQNGDYCTRSHYEIYECNFYVYLPNDTVAHIDSAKTDDPSAARSNHGDRVISAALAYHAAVELQKADATEVENIRAVPVGSLAWRRKNIYRVNVDGSEREQRSDWCQKRRKMAV